MTCVTGTAPASLALSWAREAAWTYRSSFGYRYSVSDQRAGPLTPARGYVFASMGTVVPAPMCSPPATGYGHVVAHRDESGGSPWSRTGEPASWDEIAAIGVMFLTISGDAHRVIFAGSFP